MTPVPEGWQQVQVAGRFVFSIPPAMHPVPVQGIDSAMGLYRSESCQLVFDYGRYADPLDYQDRQAYSEEWGEIDGKRAKLVTFTDPDRRDGATSIAAVHFPDVGDGPMRLTMQVACSTPGERDAAKQIFRTIGFP